MPSKHKLDLPIREVINKEQGPNWLRARESQLQVLNTGIQPFSD